MSECPCGSGNTLEACCLPLIKDEVKAIKAEALMRARYTAHTIGEMDFIFATHHPSSRSEIDESATARWASESEWLGLDIIDVEAGQEDDDQARIEFKARYRDASRRRHTHHELALFEKYHGQWYFRDAELPSVRQIINSDKKQGRNDPCACGSGKKYKKCCGLAA